MKNKKLLWILGILILVASSVMVEGAIGDRLRSITTVRGISVSVFVINTVIIALFLYVIFGVLGKKFKFFSSDSKFGKAVLLIVVVGFAIAIAFRVGNLWIWQEDAAIRPAFRYLFGEGGILRPSRILIFIGASALLSWLFTSKVKIGQGKNFVDITIAVILAAAMTREGLTKGTLIAGGQLISIILLYLQFEREGEEGFSLSAAVWSVGLVIWISAIAFPGQGLGFLKGITSKVVGFGHFRYLIYLIVFGLIAMTVGYFYKRKEKEAKGKIAWAKNPLQYIGQRFINLANKIRWPFIGWLLKKADIHDLTPGAPEKDEFSFSIKKVWTELFASMNYLLRLEVYYSKGGAVLKDLYRTLKLHKKHDLKIYPKETLHMWFDMLKNGTGYRKNNGAFEPDTSRKYINVSNEGEWDTKYTIKEGFYGKMGVRWIMFSFLEQFKKDIESVTENSIVAHEKQELSSNIDVIKESLVDAFGKIKDSEKRYDKFVLRIGARNVIDSYRMNILNQLNRYGSLFKHNYKYAKKGAKIYNVVCDVDKSKDQPFGKITLDRNPRSAVYSGRDVTENLKDEVDLNGFFLEDWNEFRKESTHGRRTIRRVMFKDAIEHPDFSEACKWEGIEWDFYIKDFRDGRFHPKSRTVSDYTELHAEKRKYGYRGVKQTHGAPDRGNPAFDREALKDIGRFVSYGRRNPNDEEESDMTVVESPFPAITSIGLTTYINSYIDEFAKESGKKQKRFFVHETGEEEKLFTNYPEKKGES